MLPLIPSSSPLHLFVTTFGPSLSIFHFLSLDGVQGHVLLTTHSLLQDLPRGAHFLFTYGPLIHMIRFVASLKLTCFLYLVDLCDIVYVAYIVSTVLFVRRC